MSHVRQCNQYCAQFTSLLLAQDLKFLPTLSTDSILRNSSFKSIKRNVHVQTCRVHAQLRIRPHKVDNWEFLWGTYVSLSNFGDFDRIFQLFFWMAACQIGSVSQTLRVAFAESHLETPNNLWHWKKSVLRIAGITRVSLPEGWTYTKECARQPVSFVKSQDTGKIIPSSDSFGGLTRVPVYSSAIVTHPMF